MSPSTKVLTRRVAGLIPIRLAIVCCFVFIQQEMARPNWLGRRAILLYEEYLEERQRLSIERRWLRDNRNPFDVREEDFKRYFRVTKDIAGYLCGQLEPALRNRRAHGLSVQTQVLVTLRFLAEGSYQRGVGQDFYTCLSQPSVSNCIRRVTQAMCNNMAGQWIKFPENEQEKDSISNRFRPKVGFPGIVGAIDCTHVAISTPIIHEESYKNHKGFYSLNVQMITDDNMRVMNCACYAGTVHDQFIWNFSSAKAAMREAHQNGVGRYYLLGDSGYALEPWLLTPLLHAEDGSPEQRYTRAHCYTRSVVERMFGVLKGRWRCLLRDRVLHYQPNVAVKIIISCVILHNIMVHHRIQLPDIEVAGEVDGNDVENVNVIQGERLAIACRYQSEIINQYFT